MKNLLNKFGIKSSLILALTALACVCMWGCTEVTFEWYDERSKPSIAGFINDSFVVVTDCRGWYEDTETKWNSGYATETSCGHDRMMVYNYRVQEEGPRWSDSLTNKYDGKHWYQMTDSVFWRWNGDDLYLWKVGEKAHEIRLSRKNEGCFQSFEVDRIRQWLDGKFIALGGKLDADVENCQYAVLDTNAKALTYKRLDKNLEWIRECDDVRAWGDDVYCFMPGERNFEAVLLRNSKDTVDVPIKFTVGDFWGNVLRPNANLCILADDKVFCPGIEWPGDLMFYKNNDVVVDLKLNIK